LKLNQQQRRPAEESVLLESMSSWRSASPFLQSSVADGLDAVCDCQKFLYARMFARHKNDVGKACLDSHRKEWRANCTAFDGALRDLDWPNYAIAPYSMLGQWSAMTLMAATRSVFPQFSIFVDVGANVGHATHEIVTRWTGGSSTERLTVVAVEPHGPNVGLLRREVASLKKSLHSRLDVRTRHAAVSSASSEGAIFHGGGEWGKLATIDPVKVNHRPAATVAVTTVDEIVSDNGLPRVDLLKVDTHSLHRALFLPPAAFSH
jgi:FkbM family methyltransferase